VTRLAEHWGAPPPNDASLGEMNYYPRGAHYMAAIVGSLFGSSLMGMQLVALVSLMTLWAGMIWIVLSLPQRQARTGAWIMAVTLVLGFRKMEMHGDELVGNFFYSQLVAQAMVLAAVAALLKLESRGLPSWMRNTLMTITVVLTTGVHLLPALELLGMMCAMIAIELWQHWRARRPGLLRAGVVGALFALGACALLFKHPAFAAMREISRNNGALVLRSLHSMSALMVFGAAVALLCCALIWRWLSLEQARRGSAPMALKYVGSYGLAVAGMCLLQGVALSLGSGSDYAVKKHIFALDGAALLALALLPLLFSLPRDGSQANQAQPGIGALLHDSLLPAIVLTLAFFCVTVRKEKIDVSNTVALERELGLRRDLLIPRQSERYTYVAALDGLSPQLAYMMTLGVFHAPRLVNAQDIMNGRIPSDWDSVGTLLTSENSALDKTQCRRAAPAHGIAMIDGQCIATLPEFIRPRFKFGARDADGKCSLEGFSHRESSGTWTEAGMAKISCPLLRVKGRRATSVEISANAFVSGKAPRQRVNIGIAGQTARTVRYDEAHSDQTISLALPADVGERVEIDLGLPDAVSPQQLGLSTDTRKLGLFVQSIEFK
jgi:hypothetical protein